MRRWYTNSDLIFATMTYFPKESVGGGQMVIYEISRDLNIDHV